MILSNSTASSTASLVMAGAECLCSVLAEDEVLSNIPQYKKAAKAAAKTRRLPSARTSAAQSRASICRRAPAFSFDFGFDDGKMAL